MKLSDLLDGLKSLTHTRTAPYQELEATVGVHEWLKKLKIQVETDNYGNTVARVRKGMPRRTVALVTHLDRPALRVTSVKGQTIQTVAEGPVPSTGFKTAKLVFPKTKEGEIKATVASSKGTKERTESATLKVAAKGPVPQADDFATFELGTFARKENALKGPGLHVAANAATMIATLADLSEGSQAVDVYAIFTRARHASFGGAVAIAVDFHLPRDTILFCVTGQPETRISKGKGPAILMGDAEGPYDPRATAVLLGAALEGDGKKFAFQRGAALGEALLPSVFLTFGLSAGGIALPVKSYQHFGPRGIATEEMDLRDLQHASELLARAAVRASAGGDDLEQRRNALILSSADGREKLREPIDPVTGYPTGARF